MFEFACDLYDEGCSASSHGTQSAPNDDHGYAE